MTLDDAGFPLGVFCHEVNPVFKIADEIGFRGRLNAPGERCSYCGSIRPRDLVEAIEQGRATGVEWADLKYGWPHKMYLEIDGVHSKFYSEHLRDIPFPSPAFDRVNKAIEPWGIRFAKSAEGKLQWAGRPCWTDLDGKIKEHGGL